MQYLHFLFLILPLTLTAQETIPAEGAQLNYIQVLFQTPAVHGAETYKFLIAPADGNLHSAPIVRVDSTHVCIIDGLEFGTAYQWLVLAKDKNGQEIFESDIHHFSIGRSLAADTTEYQYSIQRWEKDKIDDGVIFLDYSGVAIDRSGKAIWYMPNMGMNLREDRSRDLKMTENGTLTLVGNQVGVEFDLAGNLLWKTPGDGKISGDSTEFYHHEFTRLKSGNYLVLCNGFEDKSLDLADRHIDRIPLSYVVEYDKQGDTVWTWNSGMYVTHDDYLSVGTKVFNGNSFGHMNSAYADEENSLIYIGFRDLSAVLLVDKKTRKVIRSYGDKIPSDQGKDAIGFFQKQHAAIPFGNNELVVFNNNVVGATSSVVVFNEPTPDKPACKIQWEFPCDFDSLRPGNSDRLGNVQPMPNDQFLVNMGMVPRLFEVNRKNEVLWDCFPERWNRDSSRWDPFPNYRLHYRKSLYPCYFSIALKEDESKTPFLAITNEGSEDDVYSINLILPGKKPKVKYTYNLPLEAERSSHFDLVSKVSKRVLSRPLTIQVSSKNNPALLRELTFRLDN